jgi:uridine kinase
MQNIKIRCKNETYEITPLLTVEEFIDKYNVKHNEPVAVVINGHLTRLDKKLRVDSTVELIDLHTPQGKKIYESSLFFLLTVAFNKKFPQLSISIEHALVRGVYLRIFGGTFTESNLQELDDCMRSLVAKNLQIIKHSCDWDMAMNLMGNEERADILNLYRYYAPTNYKYYELEDIREGLYLPLVPKTGILKYFSLTKYQEGLVVIIPDFDLATKELPSFLPAPKVYKSFLEFDKWVSILNVHTVGDLNKHIMNGQITELIKTAEAFHEKKVANIADQISNRDRPHRLVLIAGPSSSGKTTFAKRLEIQLKINGQIPTAISLDNYFVDRDKTPRDHEGNYDFENIEAIDIELFSDHMNKLLNGERVVIPRFSFHLGSKIESSQILQLKDNQTIIVEGIHGLNPLLTSNIQNIQETFKVYIAPITPINLHHHDHIESADIRLIRRLVRDSFFRGYSASETLTRWNSVRKGEQKNIFPLQEESDAIFNSALFYELSVLKYYAERELLHIERDNPSYPEGQRLLKLLSYFLPMNERDVPDNSILKEFIGGSSFHY